MSAASPLPGSVVDRLGFPCPRASADSYPLAAACAHCRCAIHCADGTADWAHTSDGRPACNPVAHHVRWFGRIAPCDEYPDGYVPRTRFMPGSAWGWDARCSCGWDTRTGGAIQESIRRDIAQHRADVASGWWPMPQSMDEVRARGLA